MKKYILSISCFITLFLNCTSETFEIIKVNSLIDITEESASENCVNGGYKINIGIDNNGNNLLDLDEITDTNYVCNGVNAIDGENGYNILSKITSKSDLTNCNNGGLMIFFGLDVNKNNLLDNDEILNESYICNGENGVNSLFNIIEESQGQNCQYGGFKIEVGIDINSNKILDENEVTSVNYACSIKSTPSNHINMKYNIEMIGTYGQSLAVGGESSDSSTDFKNSPTFAGGSSIFSRDFDSESEKNIFFGSDFILLEENDANEQYPPATATLTTVLSLIKSEDDLNIEDYDYQLMPFTGGASGSSILSLNKGTTPYSNYLECIAKAKEFANKEGKTFGVRVINWIQGETDRFMTKAKYKSHLKKLFIDFNSDIKAITKQQEDVKFITYQVSPWLGRKVEGELMNNMDISEAHVEIATENNNVYSCGAMYQFKYTDSFHPIDRAVPGLQQGVAFKRIINDGKDWKTFKPIAHQIISDGTKYFIHLKFNVPVKPLRFNISGDDWHNPKGKQKNFGFELLKDGKEKQRAPRSGD